MKAVSVLAAVLALMSVGAAVAEERPLASFFHQSWGFRQGAPGSAVSIALTTDG